VASNCSRLILSSLFDMSILILALLPQIQIERR
jgi:hypothetical protein